MQATDLAALVVCIVSLVAIAGLTIAAGAIVRTMRELRGLLETLQSETLPLVSELRNTVDQAEVDLARVEGILSSAERISHTVDAASQLTYRAISPPIIRTMSLMAGLRSGGRRLLGRTNPVVDGSEAVNAVAVADGANAALRSPVTPDPVTRRRGRRRRLSVGQERRR